MHADAIALGDWHDGPTCPPPAPMDRPLRHASPVPRGFGSGTTAGFSACERREAPLPSGLKCRAGVAAAMTRRGRVVRQAAAGITA
ncbi:hypothetical protein XTPLMG728_3315 [Xanthomonas translucens pv. poae]|uniref:Uncharacterized protein n=1 Tax=Xanthomonas graminis pv. poae TaxID=227946 RepID=A0A0K3A809_9XANT|nr:hypothetical protein [Xanthomonas translucens]UKE62173.1 hypothetical protein KM539_00945 [Xanthomonas translucens pv. poae]CTP92649.1 hypothetical protein XTPLMG728_3315 [Xanthomonas translucens pv. poae]